MPILYEPEYSLITSDLHDLPLADKTFGTPNKIDISIGTPFFAHLLLPEVAHASDVTQTPQGSTLCVITLFK